MQFKIGKLEDEACPKCGDTVRYENNVIVADCSCKHVTENVSHIACKHCNEVNIVKRNFLDELFGRCKKCNEDFVKWSK